jgi:hypothetical protein
VELVAGEGMIAIALGSANCMDEDLAAAKALAPDAIIIACNHAARDYPGKIDHWASMHPDLMPKWIRERALAGLPPVINYWYPRHRAVHCAIAGAKPIDIWGGSSGLLCVRIAIELGADKIICAGIPLRQTFCHKGAAKQWTEARQYRAAWQRYGHRLQGRVKSLSGWTREYLGAPTEEWINGGTA